MYKTKNDKYEATRDEHFRFIKVNGTMKKIHVRSADSAFKAAMKVRNLRKKEAEKELRIHGVTS